MDYSNAPVEWHATTDMSEYYMDTDTPSTISLPKTAGLMSRAFKVGMSEPTMIGVGAYSRTNDKMNNINNNTLNYSIGKTF